MAEPAEGEGAGVTFALDSESALVLFDLLSREIDGEQARRLGSFCRTEAEFWALDSRLATPFSPEAGALFDAAAARLVARFGPWPHSGEDVG